jgi:hypothetical protein
MFTILVGHSCFPPMVGEFQESRAVATEGPVCSVSDCAMSATALTSKARLSTTPVPRQELRKCS